MLIIEKFFQFLFKTNFCILSKKIVFSEAIIQWYLEKAEKISAMKFLDKVTSCNFIEKKTHR